MSSFVYIVLKVYTVQQRTNISNYHSIIIDGEEYFSTTLNGKGVSVVLFYAKQHGVEKILDELERIKIGMREFNNLAKQFSQEQK